MNEFLVSASAVLVILAIGIALIRFFIGPSSVDRLVCLDLLGTSVAAVLAIQATIFDQHLYLDAILVLSIILFLGTVIFAGLIEKQGITEEADD